MVKKKITVIAVELDNNLFFEYGGMKEGQNTKLHIADTDGNVLCGVKSLWMQQYNKIPSSGEVHASYGIGNIKDLACTCKKCLKKWEVLKGLVAKKIDEL